MLKVQNSVPFNPIIILSVAKILPSVHHCQTEIRRQLCRREGKSGFVTLPGKGGNAVQLMPPELRSPPPVEHGELMQSGSDIPAFLQSFKRVGLLTRPAVCAGPG